jgi:hypothetical protein
LLASVLIIVWLGAAGTALLWGLEYYLLPLNDRVFSPLHPLFGPTGVVGQGLGVIGTTLIVVGVVGYAARKRLGFLRRTGALKHWLQVHIFLCTLGPFFVLLHTTFKFGGLVSVAFWSMTLVVASGVFGRYVYARIPKTLNGRFLELEIVRERTRTLTVEILGRLGLETSQVGLFAEPVVAPSASGSLGALRVALGEDLASRFRQRRIRRFLQGHAVPRAVRTEVMGLVRERDRLHLQTLLLRPFQRLFRYWHVIHLPLAMVMFLILGIHVTVAVLFGYTWIF